MTNQQSGKKGRVILLFHEKPSIPGSMEKLPVGPGEEESRATIKKRKKKNSRGQTEIIRCWSERVPG